MLLCVSKFAMMDASCLNLHFKATKVESKLHVNQLKLNHDKKIQVVTGSNCVTQKVMGRVWVTC